MLQSVIEEFVIPQTGEETHYLIAPAYVLVSAVRGSRNDRQMRPNKGPTWPFKPCLKLFRPYLKLFKRVNTIPIGVIILDMPSRRSVLFGVGSLVSGASVVFGTGAFTSVQAERGVSVETTGDESAFLALDATKATNGAYASEIGDDGQLQIDIGDLSDSSRDQTVEAGGSGVNKNAVTIIRDIFVVRNQGTQTVEVRFKPIENDGSLDLAAERPGDITPGKKDKAYIWFNEYGDDSDEVEIPKYDNGQVTLDVGEQVEVDMAIQLKGDYTRNFGNIEVIAESTQ